MAIPPMRHLLVTALCDIDAVFHHGYAHSNPTLVGAVVQAAALLRLVDALSAERTVTLSEATTKLYDIVEEEFK